MTPPRRAKLESGDWRERDLARWTAEAAIASQIRFSRWGLPAAKEENAILHALIGRATRRRIPLDGTQRAAMPRDPLLVELVATTPITATELADGAAAFFSLRKGDTSAPVPASRWQDRMLLPMVFAIYGAGAAFFVYLAGTSGQDLRRIVRQFATDLAWWLEPSRLVGLLPWLLLAAAATALLLAALRVVGRRIHAIVSMRAAARWLRRLRPTGERRRRPASALFWILCAAGAAGGALFFAALLAPPAGIVVWISREVVVAGLALSLAGLALVSARASLGSLVQAREDLLHAAQAALNAKEEQ